MSRRPALAALIVCAFGLTAFQTANPGYSINFPKGWTARPTDASTGISGVVAPDGMTNCNAQSNAMPAMNAFTQDQLNAEMATPMDVDGWANLISVDPALLEVRDAEARDIGGMYLQIATLELKVGAKNNPVPIIARMATIPMPGRLVNAGCYAQADVYPRHAALFEATVGSIRPR